MISRNSSLEEIKLFLKSCLNKLYESDSELFNTNNGKGVCERCMVFRFAHYLQDRLPGFYVDCDFNSSLHGHFENGNLVWQRRSGKPIENPDGTITNRFVDIIVHKRQDFQINQPNTSDFICFEIKKWNNHNATQANKDKQNLKILTSRYGYKYGFFLTLHKNKAKSSWLIFQHGNPLEENLIIFNNEIPNQIQTN